MYDAADRERIRARFQQLSSANVADVLDAHGRKDQALDAGFRGFSGDTLAGWAYTILGESRETDGSPDARKVEACAQIGPGEISVWSGGAAGFCYFGEMLALGMQRQGAVGALSDGGIRDIDAIAANDFPVFARYRTPVQSIGRWVVTDTQVPVQLPGATAATVTVNPGDFVLADCDGVIVVPADVLEPVLAETEELEAREEEIRSSLGRGISLDASLAQYGNL